MYKGIKFIITTIIITFFWQTRHELVYNCYPLIVQEEQLLPPPASENGISASDEKSLIGIILLF